MYVCILFTLLVLCSLTSISFSHADVVGSLLVTSLRICFVVVDVFV